MLVAQLAIMASPPRLAADPLPMSDVTLTGEWGKQTQRNADVLLSLNLTKWACHFTTTANLTACRTASTPWHTYVKDAPGNFTHKQGFLAAGDDVKPPASVTFSACESFCQASTLCAGFTFQALAAVPTDPVRCYWKAHIHFTPDARTNCVAPGNASQPVCEPLPGEMGLGGYYGHYQGHWLSATSFLINATGNASVRTAATAAIDTLEAVMGAWRAKYGAVHDGYLFPYDPVVFERLLSGHGARPWYSVPFYTLHKLMAGLLDQYVFAGSAKAFQMVLRMAAWVRRHVEATIASGGEALWQTVLLTEWGGMNDVLLELYRHTQNADHLATARRFNGWVFTARLAAGQDDLADLPFPHANFHLPEIVGNARAYELTGNLTDQRIVAAFFGALTANHSYCTGGSNSGECWQQPRDLGNFLSTQTEESCTQYNVLKIARHLFRWHAEPRFTDFYERAILNGIVGNQKAAGLSSCGTPAGCSECERLGGGSDDAEGGGERLSSSSSCRSPGARGASAATSYIYMLPLGGVVRKAWGKSDYGFPCCWGTLSESFSKLSDSIYFGAPDGSAFYVNLFVSSVAKWAGNPGVTIEQAAYFPSDPKLTGTITVRIKKPVGRAGPQQAPRNVTGEAGTATSNFSLRIRVPSWLKTQGSAQVNGKPAGVPPVVAGTYLDLTREWADGDVVDFAFPPSLWTAPLNDKHAWHNATVAFMYGPLVLAGVGVASDLFVPNGKATAPDSFIVRNSSSDLQFEATSATGGKMKLIPLREVMDESYVAYFYTAGTKPPQPAVHYCPHSQGGISEKAHQHHAHHDHDHGSSGGGGEDGDDGDDEDRLVTAGPPPSSPRTNGRGVRWQVTPSGQMMSVTQD